MPAVRNAHQHAHQRLLLPTSPSPSPPKDLTEVQRSVVADRLVDASVALVNSIWFAPLPISGNATPPSSQSSSTSHELDADKHCTAAPQLPLRLFIRETLRRSRTSCSTLQAALLYCARAQRAVTRSRLEAVGRFDDAAHVGNGQIWSNGGHGGRVVDEDQDDIGKDLHAFDKERGYYLAPSPSQPTTTVTHQFEQDIQARSVKQDATERISANSPLLQRNDDEQVQFYYCSDRDVAIAATGQGPSAALLRPPTPNTPPANTASVLLCGRRMFLAAVMTASKFLQDHNYQNRAWARISGLSVTELVTMERCFLSAIGYRLNVRGGPAAWANWVVELEIRAAVDRARREVEAVASHHQAVMAPASVDTVTATVATDDMLDLSECSDSNSNCGDERKHVDGGKSARTAHPSSANSFNHQRAEALQQQNLAAFVATAERLASALSAASASRAPHTHSTAYTHYVQPYALSHLGSAALPLSPASSTTSSASTESDAGGLEDLGARRAEKHRAQLVARLGGATQTGRGPSLSATNLKTTTSSAGRRYSPFPTAIKASCQEALAR